MLTKRGAGLSWIEREPLERAHEVIVLYSSGNISALRPLEGLKRANLVSEVVFLALARSQLIAELALQTTNETLFDRSAKVRLRYVVATLGGRKPLR